MSKNWYHIVDYEGRACHNDKMSSNYFIIEVYLELI